MFTNYRLAGMPVLARHFVTLSLVSLSVVTQGATASEEKVTPERVELDAIMVTGENTSRSIRNTASSVVVMAADELDEMPGATTTNDVLDLIPGLVTSEPGNLAPAVRGVDGTGPASGANAFFAGTRPRLNYQIDGRTLGFNEAVFQNFSLWDVEQIEVYRGPQSGQQGRNAIAGAIIMRTADPTFEREGKVRVITGQQDTRGAAFAFSGPLIDDKLAFRLSGNYQTSQSAVDFTAYPEESDPDEYRTASTHGKLLFTPNDDFRSLLTLGITDGKSPQSEYVVKPYGSRQAESPAQPTFESVNKYGIWDAEWHYSDQITLENTLSVTGFRTKRHSPAGTGNLEIDGDELMAQPIVRFSNESGNLTGFTGLYLFKSDQDEEIDLFGGGQYRDKTRNQAIFSELNWVLGNGHQLTLAGRYETEKRTRKGAAGPLALDFSETYRTFMPKAIWSVDQGEWTFGVAASRGYNGGGAGITFSPPFVSYTYDPEYVNSYEGFIRGSALNKKMTLTANLFYNRFRDMQLPYSLSANSTVIRNADKASVFGAEAGVKYHLSSMDEVFMNLALIKTRIDSYDGSGIEGKELTRAPAFALNAGFRAEPFPDVVLSSNVRYTDAYYSDADNTPRGKVDAYALVNARLSYSPGPYDIYLDVYNLADADNEVAIYPARDSATLLKPRTITAGIQYHF